MKYTGPSAVLKVGSGNINENKQQHEEHFILTAKALFRACSLETIDGVTQDALSLATSSCS